MPAITDMRVVEERVRELNRSCQINYETKEGVRVSVSASIGIVISDADDDYESLYKKADEALYQSKRAGKNSYYFYE